MEVDLVVVGFGGAGAAAAITAHDLGASVVVLEKQAADAHTPSTRMSGGLVMAVDDAASGSAYLDACAGGMVPPDVSAAWATSALDVLRWLEKTTGTGFTRINTAEHPELPGADAVGVYQQGAAAFRLDPSAGGGDALFAGVAAAVRARGIDVRYSSPASRLVVEDGRVVGVQAGDVVIRARAVVLACGGYEFDERAKRDNLRAYPVHFYGNPGNTGDGVRMAQAAGADLWHMNQMIGRAVGHFTHPDGRELSFNISINPPGYVITDKYGHRFANEYLQAVSKPNFYYELLHYDADLLEHPRIPGYWICDQRRIDARPLSGGSYGHYAWSKDNSAEIEMGWIAKGDTVEDAARAEAARAAGMPDPEAAARGVAEYNAICAAGVDPLGRPPETLVPLDEPPYYCVPLYPGGSNTCGGPRRDASSRVLDPYDDPIPGLYAVGELGQPVGMLYPADGANLSEAFCFGRIAARAALED